ncbi:MAG: ABC transporter permease [Phycisphaerae bacterium]|jgi:ribose transport system permease protein|nr:ABC transporter permease [Phycisphaerae bacterium]
MKRFIASLFRPQYVLLWVFFAMLVLFCVAAPSFRSASNLIRAVKSSSVIAVMVLGLTWIVASGEIDVSFPSVAGLASVVTALLIKNDVPWIVAPLIAIAAGTLFGLLSGFLIAVFRCPSLIATIAIGSIATGAACILAGGYAPVRLSSTVGLIKTLGSGGMGVQLGWIAIVLAGYLAFKYIQDHTTTGQHLYALGENRQASLEAGIREKKTIISFFSLSAMLASCGGVIWVLFYAQGVPRMEGTVFIDGMTAVFLGALVVKAGKPNVIGTFIGAIFLAVLTNGLTPIGLEDYYGSMIKGALMIFGVVIIAISKYKVAKRASRGTR